MKNKPLLRFTISCVMAASALVCTLPFAAPPKPPIPTASPAAKAEAEVLAQRAEKLLDQWKGQRGILIEADKLIADALARDPLSAHAITEKGRLLIMASNTSGSHLDPDGAQAAADMLQRAAKADPAYARAFTLQGHLYTLIGRMEDARKALLTADRIGTNDPWQDLNWADYLRRTGAARQSVLKCEKVLKGGTQNVKALGRAWDCVEKYYSEDEPNRKRSDEAYQEVLKLNPESAYQRGDRAQALAVYFQDFDAAEKLARETIAISNYGQVRGTLSLALYSKWARAIEANKDAGTIQSLLQAARAVDPDTSMLPACAVGRPSFAFLMKELEKRALAQNQPLNLRSC